MNTTIAFLYSWIKHKNGWLITTDIASSSFIDIISTQTFIVDFIYYCFSEVKASVLEDPKALAVHDMIDWVKNVIKHQFGMLELQPYQLLRMLKSPASKTVTNKSNTSSKRLLNVMSSGLKAFPIYNADNVVANKSLKDYSTSFTEETNSETPKKSKTKIFRRELSLNFHAQNKASLSDFIEVNLLYQTLFTLHCLHLLTDYKDARRSHDLFFLARAYLSKEAFRIINEVLQWTDFDTVENIELLFGEEYLNSNTLLINMEDRLISTPHTKQKFSELQYNCEKCAEANHNFAVVEDKLKASLETCQQQNTKINAFEERIIELQDKNRNLTEKTDEFRSKYLKQFSLNTKKLTSTKQETKNKIKSLSKEVNCLQMEIERLKKVNTNLTNRLADAEHKESELKLDLHHQLASVKSQLAQRRSFNATPKSTKLFNSSLSLNEPGRKTLIFNNYDELDFRRVTELSLDKLDLDELNSGRSDNIQLNEVWSDNSNNEELKIKNVIENEAFCLRGVAKVNEKERVGLTAFLIFCLMILSICYSLK